MAVIDTLTAKTRNWLKKTGDTMISGFLTLYQDPTEDLHAVTKRYVDGLTGGGSIQAPYGIGTYYSNQFSTSNTGNTLGTGDACVHPFYVGKTRSWDRIGIVGNRSGGAGTAVVRLGVYSMDETTLAPTALLLDAGSVSTSSGTQAFLSLVISLTTTAKWIGLGMLVDPTSTTGFVRQAGVIQNTGYVHSPLGRDAPLTGAVISTSRFLFSATGQPTGAMPPYTAFSLDTSILSYLDSGVQIRMSA